MAAATASNVKLTVFGDKNIVIATLVIAADADTWVVPGLGVIDAVDIVQKSGTAQGTVLTWSGATITFTDIAAGATYGIKVTGS